MATAPAPGSVAAEQASRLFLRLRIRDRELDVVPTPTMDEKFTIRAVARVSFESIMDPLGDDSLCVLWWLARRQNGEPKLPLPVHIGEWEPVKDETEFDVTEIDLDGEPEQDDSPGEPGPDS